MASSVLHRRLACQHAADDLDVFVRPPEGGSNACPYHPSTSSGPDTPRPSTKRPWDRWSRVSAAIAVAAGVRAAMWAMQVPSRIRVVCEPSQASGVSASDPDASPIHRDS